MFAADSINVTKNIEHGPASPSSQRPRALVVFFAKETPLLLKFK
jgi:hypothetical protein